MRNGKRLEYEWEWGGLYLGLAAGNLRIDQKAKRSEKFFVSPKRSTKDMQAFCREVGTLCVSSLPCFSSRGSGLRATPRKSLLKQTKKIVCLKTNNYVYLCMWVCPWECRSQRRPEGMSSSRARVLWASWLGCWEMILGPNRPLFSSCGLFNCFWFRACLSVVLCAPQCGCGGQRTPFGSWFLVWPMWVPGIKLGSWDTQEQATLPTGPSNQPQSASLKLTDYPVVRNR